MTLRERIADWISGGALRREIACAADWEAAFIMEADEHRLTWERAIKRRDQLARIAACQTPGANATVSRMAKIAREATE